MDTFTIKEMSDLFHLPSSTLRYYEEIGILKDIERTSSRQRIFTKEHIHQLKLICCLKRAGLTISEIKKFFLLEADKPTNIDNILALLKSKKTKIENNIKQFSIDLDHIEDKINYYIEVKKAIEETKLIPVCKDYLD